MPKIDIIIMRCLDREEQRRFYVEVLGMALREDGAVSYGLLEAGLVFKPATKPYRQAPNDLYWKIALAVPNIELASEQLKAKGIAVNEPCQFCDIGYLAHFKDPEGFTIELIER